MGQAIEDRSRLDPEPEGLVLAYTPRFQGMLESAWEQIRENGAQCSSSTSPLPG